GRQRGGHDVKRIPRPIAALTLFAAAARGDEKKPATPGPNKPDEAKSKSASIDKGAEFLDVVSANWTTGRKCGTCHTNVPHLLASAALKRKPTEQETLVRKFFEDRATNCDRADKGDNPPSATQVAAPPL